MTHQKKEQTYSIRINGDTLTFRTTSFTAEKGSVLHSGIYNRELTSSLVAGAVVVIVALILLFSDAHFGGWHYAGLSVLFFTLFALLRLYVFYESYVEVVIDKTARTISFFKKGIRNFRRKVPLGDLKDITSGYKVIVPENPDGIQVVEKIALQHGTVIPGFGEVKEFHTVHLEFENENGVMIFTSPDKAEAQYVQETFKRHIGGGVAKKD